MEELLTFLMVLLILIKIFLKPSSLKQHKIELEQYPVVPISTARRSMDHPSDNISAFKANYLLILVLHHDSIFPLQEYVNSMTMNFLKLLETIVILGLALVKAEFF